MPLGLKDSSTGGHVGGLGSGGGATGELAGWPAGTLSRPTPRTGVGLGPGPCLPPSSLPSALGWARSVNPAARGLGFSAADGAHPSCGGRVRAPEA